MYPAARPMSRNAMLCTTRSAIGTIHAACMKLRVSSASEPLGGTFHSGTRCAMPKPSAWGDDTRYWSQISPPNGPPKSATWLPRRRPIATRPPATP